MSVLPTSQHLSQFGVSASEAKQWILANASSPETIFVTCDNGRVSNEMIAEILGGVESGFTTDLVKQFFNSAGFNADQLDTTVAVDFTGQSHTDNGLEFFSRKVSVFGIPIYAAPDVSPEKLSHAANVMAEYLDNDEDGFVDNEGVVKSLVNTGHRLLMWSQRSDFDQLTFAADPETISIQDLGNSETNPAWHLNPQQEIFDASLEEILHMITEKGYALVYPQVFGEFVGSTVANLMDQARGGQFLTLPSEYPADAWFTYDDPTSDYATMVTEYLYWAITSKLGAQRHRGSEIADEWIAYSPDLLEQIDPGIVQLIGNPTYHLPSALPDGDYL